MRLPGAILPAIALVLAPALVALSVGCGADGPQAFDMEGHRVDAVDDGARATVWVFVRHDCPISNRYAPEIQRLTVEYGSRGIRFYLVYPDPDETRERVLDHRAQYGLTATPLHDPHHELVRQAEVRVTPEAAVVVDGRIVYRGHIDDRYVDFGQARPQPTHRSLRDALEAVLADRTPSVARTRAVGCPIADLT